MSSSGRLTLTFMARCYLGSNAGSNSSLPCSISWTRSRRSPAGRAKISDMPDTLPAVLAETVAARGGEPAYSDRHAADGWRTLTWSEVVGTARNVAGALIDSGVQPGDTVALM